MPVVISNSSPLQYLYQADVLELLPALYGRLAIPRAVEEELLEGRRLGVSLPNLKILEWVEIRSVRNRALLPLATRLGDGEKEVLALGQESPGALLLLDDRLARRYAQALGLKTCGTLGVLLAAKSQGLLKEVRPALDRLHNLRFRLSAATLQSALELAGEAD